MANTTDFEFIEATVRDMLHDIAFNNCDFKCSCCMDTAYKLLGIAREFCGADMAGILQEEFEAELNEDEAEEEA